MATPPSVRENMKPLEWDIMGKSTTLWTLDLSGEHLKQLPDELFELNELQALKLDRNKNIQLSEKLTRLTNLKVLSLKECNLETVPAAVMKLTQLQTLILSNNRNITLPDEMSSLVNLIALETYNCDLDSLPPVVLKLSLVHSLDLSHNEQISLPDELCRLENIKVLRLRGCTMATVPSAVLKLTQLEKLDIGGNSGIHLPDEMSGLGNIRVLELWGTDMATVPPLMWRLTQLEWLGLSFNPLQTLPAEVGQLTNVKHLDLSGCQLRTLPPVVRRLTQLEWLGLSSNPLQTLHAGVGKLTNVKKLHLSHCQLRTLPPEVWILTQLEWLYLSSNPLQTLPAEVGQLTNVKYLDLSHCKLRTLPSEVQRLTQLVWLYLSRNPLQTLPAEVGQLINVKHLNLSHCQLRTLPPEVGNLKQLERLDLSWNLLQTLPAEMGQLTNVKHLYLSGCQLHTLPPEVWRLTQLEWLDLSHNPLQTLPAEIGQLTNVKHLDLSRCQLRTLPPEVLRLAQLEWLNLSSNPLQTLPAEVKQLTNVKHLDLSNCQLHTLPPEVGRLTQLKRLDLSSNLPQTLPAEVGQLTNIKHLDLSHCQLSTLPPEVGKLTQLERLYLSSNPLQTLPAEVKQLTNVKYLNLSQCQLRTLPHEVGSLAQLEWLLLSSNPLQTLPAEVGQLTNVKHLDLSRCELRTLPHEVGRLTQLEWLDLSENPLQTIPAEVGHLINIKHLNLSYCQLRTPLPEVGRLALLEELDLSSNQLQTLPPEVGQLTNVKHLDLSYCDMSTLPPEVGRLTQLERLNLRSNQLQTLPAEVGQLNSLSHLDVIRNPLIKPPIEVSIKGVTAIKQYFDELERSEEDVSARLKVVVLGEKMAGKTSMVRTLQIGKSTLTKEEDRTHCVEITQWSPDDSITFEVYDFGGHDVYHLTHQFFLTPDAFYLLLVNLETYSCSEQRYKEAVGFWLDTLNTRVPGAVVSLVGSKKDRCDSDHVMRKTKDIQERIKVHMEMWETQLKQQIARLTSLQASHERRLLLYKTCDSKTSEDIAQQIAHTNNLLQQCLRICNVEDILCVSVKPKSFVRRIFSRPPSWLRLKNLLMETGSDKALFPTLKRVLPRTWVLFEQLIQVSLEAHEKAEESNGSDKTGSNDGNHRPGESSSHRTRQPAQYWLTSAECDRIGRLAELSSDRLEPVLSYLQQVGTILRYPDIPELKDLIFHDPPALIEICKGLFHHDTGVLFSTSRFAKVTSSKLENFESDLSDRGLIRKEVLMHLLPPDINFDIVTALLQNFGLCFEIQIEDKTNPSKHTSLYKIPWYLHKEMPAELNSIWSEDVPEEQEQLQLMCDITGFCPRGLFQRFSVAIHPLVKESRIDWKDGVTACIQGYRSMVCSSHTANNTYITMATRGRLDQADEMWGVVHPLLEVLVQLLQEWPGVLYSLHVTCAHCIKARLDNPHQYDLRDRTDDDGCDVWCPRVKKTASTSADLVCRPSRFTVGEHRSSLTTRRLLKKGNDYYKMTSDPRGLALIISNINFKKRTTRHGGEKDLDTLRKICAKLKLQPEIKNDLTKQGIEAVTMEVSMRDHSSYDCFVLFLLSHGGETGVLGTDGQHVSVDSIVSSFQACQSPVGKPKIFFIQACRGVDRDPGQEHTDTTGTLDEGRSTQQAGRGASDGATEPTKSPPPPTSAPAASAASLESPDAGERTLPTASDRLVMYATVHGHVSWRNSDTGTWLVQVLADVITEHAETETLLEMLTRVNAKVADFKTQHQEYKQQPEVTHTLRKKLYFFPQAAVDQNP